MTDYIKKLTELRRHEEEARNYAPSSRWYVGLSHSIQHLALADTATNPKDQFLNAWNAIYNLSMIMHSRGDAEYRTLARWIEEIQNAPEVRKLATATPLDLLAAILKAGKALLWNAEAKKWREAKTLVEAWLQKKNSLSPDKACTYIFLIGRDLRNAVSHATFSPGSTNIKRALSLAADHFIPLAEAAIRATIEHPPAGTTGRATAYRSFLYPFLKNSDSFFSDYYLERLFPDAELKTFDEDSAKQSLKELHRSFNQLHHDLLTADGEETKKLWCNTVLFPSLSIVARAGVRIVAESGVFETDYALAWADLKGKPRREYQGKDAGRDLACLIWVLPWSSNLDAVVEDPNLGVLPIMEVANRALTQADVPWGVITNGQRLRLLYKGVAHKLRSFLEVDLSAIIDRRVDSDALLAYRYLLGLFSGPSFTEKDDDDNTLLDRVLKESERHGKEIGDELKENVFRALEELGSGFLDYLRANRDEMEAWRQRRAPKSSARGFLHSEEMLTDIYHESLSLMYRLLFLFYAESRDLLPMESELYRETYSLESLRDEIISVHDDPDPKQFFSEGNFILWERLKELFSLVNKGWRDVIPAYNGGLFDPEEHGFLEQLKIGDNRLAQAIDLLSRTRPHAGRAKGEGRKKVTYRDLDVRHLGSIYEGILEYAARIAEEDLVSIKRDKIEEYKQVSELDKAEREQLRAWQEAKDENPDNPQLPRGCKITDLKEKGQYFLVYGGRESKRKSSGSYYTPDYIVQYIVENTIGPLARGENREGELKDVPLTSDEILALKVLDPAMGSGHFLVAATEYLARAYGEALVREGKDQDGVVSEEESIRFKRMVAERCIYGVDINQMAVELAKLSLWLFTMDRGRPLSFLNHHLKWGNSLIGAWIEDLGEPPEFDSKGKPKKRERSLNLNLFETRFRERVPLMLREIFAIINQETLSYKDIEVKKTLDKNVESRKQPFRNLAGIYIGTYFGEEARDYHTLLVDLEQARNRSSNAAREHHAFHWELEFPEVFFDEAGRYLDTDGFNAIIGNPPYLRIQGLQEFFDQQIDYYTSQYQSAVKRFDLYLLFSEKGFELLCEGGRLGLICPHKFINSDFGSGLREYLIKSLAIETLISFGNNLIFDQASTYTGLLLLRKGGEGIFSYYEFPEVSPDMMPNHLSSLSKDSFATYDLAGFSSSPWMLTLSSTQGLLAKLQKQSATVAEVFDNVFQGIVTGLDEVYFLARVSDEKTEVIEVYSQRENKNIKIERDILKPILKGEDVSRYAKPDFEYYCIYPYKLINEKTVILEEKELARQYPLAYKYLSRYQQELRSLRIKYKTNPIYWYSCHRGRSIMLFESKKIITPEISLGCNMTLDTKGLYHNTMIYSLVPSSRRKEHINYWLGLLNSKILWWFLINTGNVLRGGYFRFKTNYLNPFPVHCINFLDQAEKTRHDRIVSLADKLLTLHKQLATAKGASEKAKIQQEIDATDQQVDQIVYELYELTDEEIAIIREATTV